ncbi:hypothetical protein SUDANB43_06128 [Streptomyces sp. enrichment culture]
MPVPLWEAKAQFFRMLRHPVRIRVLELLLGRRRRSAALLPPRGWSCTFTVPAGVQAMQDTRTAATRWCQEATGQDAVFDQKVAKAVSDLVTGMLRHSPVAHVGLDARAGQLVIAVTDTQQHLPLLHRDPAVPGLRLEPGPAPGNPGHGAVPHGGVTVVMLRFPLPPPAASRQAPSNKADTMSDNQNSWPPQRNRPVQNGNAGSAPIGVADVLADPVCTGAPRQARKPPIVDLGGVSLGSPGPAARAVSSARGRVPLPGPVILAQTGRQGAMTCAS